jgi:hypothetical protein
MQQIYMSVNKIYLEASVNHSQSYTISKLKRIITGYCGARGRQGRQEGRQEGREIGRLLLPLTER